MPSAPSNLKDYSLLHCQLHIISYYQDFQFQTTAILHISNPADSNQFCETGGMDNESQSNLSTPALVMPSRRLNDIIEILDKKQPSVVNLDTCFLTSDSNNLTILEYVLDKIPPSVKTLSLRFNNIKDDGGQIILEWLLMNDTLEVLYLMGTNISPNLRQGIENAFKKNLVGHRTTNLGYTFIRVPPRSNVEPKEG
jgi:hypothetical protein